VPPGSRRDPVAHLRRGEAEISSSGISGSVIRRSGVSRSGVTPADADTADQAAGVAVVADFQDGEAEALSGLRVGLPRPDDLACLFLRRDRMRKPARC
jgi:hypothetical protein